MSEFINTIDVLGDDAVIDSIIMKTITEFRDNLVENVGLHAFNGCKALETVDLPKCKTIADCAFYDCSALANIAFPLAIETGDQAFCNCNSLVNVSFPSAAEISYMSFAPCTALESINAPVATVIQNCGLQGSASLSRLDLPCVSSIKSGGLNNCKALATLILRYDGVCTLADSAALQGTAIAGGTGYVYVPSAHVDSYKAASNWSAVAAQIRAIEDYPEITGG